MSARQHGVVEIELRGPVALPADRPPFRLAAEHESGERIEIDGFWDGADVYRARFLPELAGRWRWSTSSDSAALDSAAGELDVAPSEAARGPVRVDGRRFARPDGSSFHPVGATVYNWLQQSPERIAETLDAVAGAGFNKLRFLVFPQAGGHVERWPELLPFERDDDGRWLVDRPVPAYFQRLDAAVSALDERGVQAEVLLFNAYDDGVFGLDLLDEQQDLAYLRYVVARLAASPNVWWSLCNEYDLMRRPDARWDRAFQALEAADPHAHPRSIHNWVEFYDHNRPWVTHASIQNGSATVDPGRAQLYRDAYRKPVVLDEIQYEGDTVERWGDLDGPELVHRFWNATVAGCSASHGESFVLEDGSLHIVVGGPFRGLSPARLGFLRSVLEQGPVGGYEPIDLWWDETHVIGAPRVEYLQYLGRSAPASWSFRLPQGHHGERLEVGDRFSVEVVDTWSMTIGAPVTFTLSEVRRNEALAPGSVALPEGAAIALRIRRLR